MAEVKTYCFLHVYYEELVEETMGYVNNIPNLNKIFVNIPEVSEDNEDDIATKESVSKFISEGVESQFYNFKNTGRDVGAFFRLTQETVEQIQPEDIVYCIHTKACQLHELGDKWRKDLLEPILKDQETASSVLELLLNGEADYVASNRKTFDLYWPNESNYHQLCDRLKININHRLKDFTAGTIFTLRYKYLNELYGKITEDDFSDLDNHRADGLMTHAIERLFTTVVRSMDGKIKYV